MTNLHTLDNVQIFTL